MLPIISGLQLIFKKFITVKPINQYNKLIYGKPRSIKLVYSQSFQGLPSRYL